MVIANRVPDLLGSTCLHVYQNLVHSETLRIQAGAKAKFNLKRPLSTLRATVNNVS